MKNLTTKKILLTSCIISIIVIFVVILVSNNTTTSNVVDQSLMSGAAAYVPLSGEGEIFSGKDSVELKPVLNSLFNWAVAIIMVLSVIFIILGAIQYMTTDAVFDKSEGKTKITSAIAGLILALTSWVILFTIDDGLLKMDIVVPKTINNSEPSAPSAPSTPSESAPGPTAEAIRQTETGASANSSTQNPMNANVSAVTDLSGTGQNSWVSNTEFSESSGPVNPFTQVPIYNSVEDYTPNLDFRLQPTN